MLYFRFASFKDVELYFEWVNDPEARQNSLNTEIIDYQDHVKWFSEKVNNPNVFMYLFLNENNIPVGQVRIEKETDWVFIGQSIGKEHRGKKYSSEMLSNATDDFLKNYPEHTILSVVKANNSASLKMARNSGFAILTSDNQSENVLVLKGRNQNDIDFITLAKRFYNLL